MFKMGAAIGNWRFDYNSYSKKLDEALQTQMRQAARVWLRALIPCIPVWTGTARGTLIPLGRYLNVAVPIDPVKFLPGRGPSVGAQQSTFAFDNEGGHYAFRIDIGLLYFELNEFTNTKAYIPQLKKDTPWESFIVANAAWREYVRQVLPTRVPDTKSFLQITKPKSRRY
jgi:hypothetical protein